MKKLIQTILVLLGVIKIYTVNITVRNSWNPLTGEIYNLDAYVEAERDRQHCGSGFKPCQYCGYEQRSYDDEAYHRCDAMDKAEYDIMMRDCILDDLEKLAKPIHQKAQEWIDNILGKYIIVSEYIYCNNCNLPFSLFHTIRYDENGEKYTIRYQYCRTCCELHKLDSRNNPPIEYDEDFDDLPF